MLFAVRSAALRTPVSGILNMKMNKNIHSVRFIACKNVHLNAAVEYPGSYCTASEC